MDGGTPAGTPAFDPVTMSILFPYAVPGAQPRPVQREKYYEEHDYGYHLFIINRWLAGC